MTKLGTLIAIALFLLPTTAHADRVKSAKARVDIKTDKVAHLIGQVNADTFAVFETEMLTTATKPGDRLIVINSQGGLVSYGERMIALIEAERAAGTRVICVAVGNAHSMAFNILTRCDVRLATAGSTMLVHKIRYLNVICQDAACNAKKLREMARGLDQTDDPYRRANAAAMRLTLLKYDLFADAETYWKAEVLLKRGYLHGLATVEK